MEEVIYSIAAELINFVNGKETGPNFIGKLNNINNLKYLVY